MTTAGGGACKSFGCLIVKDKNSHLFKQEEELNSMVCKHWHLGACLPHAIVLKGKDLKRGKVYFQVYLILYNRHEPRKFYM